MLTSLLYAWKRWWLHTVCVRTLLCHPWPWVEAWASAPTAGPGGRAVRSLPLVQHQDKQTSNSRSRVEAPGLWLLPHNGDNGAESSARSWHWLCAPVRAVHSHLGPGAPPAERWHLWLSFCWFCPGHWVFKKMHNIVERKYSRHMKEANECWNWGYNFKGIINSGIFFILKKWCHLPWPCLLPSWRRCPYTTRLPRLPSPHRVASLQLQVSTTTVVVSSWTRGHPHRRGRAAQCPAVPREECIRLLGGGGQDAETQWDWCSVWWQ